MIATTFRSGSSFLGDLIYHYPGGIYTFEPLEFVEKEDSIRTLNDLYACQSEQSFPKNRSVIGRAMNRYTWSIRWLNICQNMLPKKQACFELMLLDSFCKIHPIRLIKTTRLRVSKAEAFMTDSSLPNFKLIALFRDPRGTMNSRASTDFCNRTEECYDLDVLCQNLDRDTKAAFEFAEKYPGKVLLIRFEDLTNEPYKIARDIIKFLGLPMHKDITQFLNRHLLPSKIKEEETVFNTYRRNSRAIATAWRETLDYE